MPSRVLTVPNVLTFARLIFLPFFAIIALHSAFMGAIILTVLASTDYIDGYIARRFHQESELGRILDPISDRVLVLLSFIIFIVTDSIPLWFVAVVGLREIVVALGTIFIAGKKKLRLDVNHRGKVSAFAAMGATPSWVMAHETHGATSTGWLLFALFGTIIAVVWGYWSLVEYVQAYRRVS